MLCYIINITVRIFVSKVEIYRPARQHQEDILSLTCGIMKWLKKNSIPCRAELKEMLHPGILCKKWETQLKVKKFFQSAAVCDYAAALLYC